jgi:hypothetical protein
VATVDRLVAPTILGPFSIVWRKDLAQWGEYRMKRMVLEKHEALEGWKSFSTG